MASAEIIPGESVGQFKLGMSLAEVEELIPIYSRESRENCSVIWTGQMGFWIYESNLKVTQILIRNHHPSKVMGKVGLGDTLVDVEKHFGPVDDKLDIYIPINYRGVGFELEDMDNDGVWSEQDAPIEAISIFS